MMCKTIRHQGSPRGRRWRPDCVRTAFTLIEVLVVVSIIALLVAVLLPSLKKARMQAKRTVCASNIKQIMTAIQMYASEYKGSIPHSADKINASLTWTAWHVDKDVSSRSGWVHHGLLHGAHQLKDPAVFDCPAYSEYPHTFPEGWETFVSLNGYGKKATSYTYALNGQIDRYPPGVRIRARQEELKSHEALLVDVFLARSARSQRAGVWAHFAGVNVGYSDGSVQLKNVKPSIAQEAVKLYDQNNIGESDYFAYCFFEMLNGRRSRIEAFPTVLPD